MRFVEIMRKRQDTMHAVQIGACETARVPSDDAGPGLIVGMAHNCS
jgi:hypothetical protein